MTDIIAKLVYKFMVVLQNCLKSLYHTSLWNSVSNTARHMILTMTNRLNDWNKIAQLSSRGLVETAWDTQS